MPARAFGITERVPQYVIFHDSFGVWLGFGWFSIHQPAKLKQKTASKPRVAPVFTASDAGKWMAETFGFPDGCKIIEVYPDTVKGYATQDEIANASLPRWDGDIA